MQNLADLERRINNDRRAALDNYIAGRVDARLGWNRRDTRSQLEIEIDNEFVNCESEKWFRTFN